MSVLKTNSYQIKNVSFSGYAVIMFIVIIPYMVEQFKISKCNPESLSVCGFVKLSLYWGLKYKC